MESIVQIKSKNIYSYLRSVGPLSLSLARQIDPLGFSSVIIFSQSLVFILNTGRAKRVQKSDFWADIFSEFSHTPLGAKKSATKINQAVDMLPGFETVTFCAFVIFQKAVCNSELRFSSLGKKDSFNLFPYTTIPKSQKCYKGIGKKRNFTKKIFR